MNCSTVGVARSGAHAQLRKGGVQLVSNNTTVHLLPITTVIIVQLYNVCIAVATG